MNGGEEAYEEMTGDEGEDNEEQEDEDEDIGTFEVPFAVLEHRGHLSASLQESVACDEHSGYSMSRLQKALATVDFILFAPVDVNEIQVPDSSISVKSEGRKW
jgi:hypothetical protein